MLVVSPPPGLPLGPFGDTLRLVFHDANGDHSLAVPFHGEITRRVVASPGTVYFDDSQGDGGRTRVLIVRRPDGQKMSPLHKIEAPPAVQAVEDSPDEAAKTVRRIRLTLNRGAPVNEEYRADLRVWIEGEADPLTVSLIAPPHSR